MKKHESGRSMIEMVGVLAVMGLITAGAFVLMRSGMSSQKRNRVQDEVANIVSTIRTLSASSQNFSNLQTAANSDANGQTLLSNLDIQTTTPFGGSTYYTVRYVDGTKFAVKVMGVTYKDCQALKAVAWADSVTSSANCLTANSTGACASTAANCDFYIQYAK